VIIDPAQAERRGGSIRPAGGGAAARGRAGVPPIYRRRWRGRQPLQAGSGVWPMADLLGVMMLFGRRPKTGNEERQEREDSLVLISPQRRRAFRTGQK